VTKSSGRKSDCEPGSAAAATRRASGSLARVSEGRQISVPAIIRELYTAPTLYPGRGTSR
jgi:hypothetical protein